MEELPKGHEPTRDTAYDRYIKYGKLPKKKNARKRVGRRVLKGISGLTPQERKKRIDELR